MRVEKIYRYPVKGLSAEALEEVALTEGAMLPHDRRFALAQGDSPFDPANPAWVQKRHFGCLMANARLALVHSAFDPRSGVLMLDIPGQGTIAEDTMTEAGRAAIAAALTAFMGDEARGIPRFLDVPGHAFSDVDSKVVSIIGLGSVQALGETMGVALDPLRFRANVYVSGSHPWAEFDWLGQEIQLGQAKLRVVKRIQRCAATEVNPGTGVRDCKPPRALREAYGHMDLGVYAEVIEAGRVAVGDALEPLQPVD